MRPPGTTKSAAVGNNCLEPLYRPEGDDVSIFPRSSERIGASGKHIHIRQRESTDNLAQKNRLLLVRLDQREVDLRSPELDRKTGKACSGTHVNHVTGEVCSADPPGLAAGNRCCATNRDSPKWRVTISSGWRIAVRLTRTFQRKSISIYIDILCSCDGERPLLKARSGVSCAMVKKGSEQLADAGGIHVMARL